jgi:hypothetical protein
MQIYSRKAKYCTVDTKMPQIVYYSTFRLTVWATINSFFGILTNTFTKVRDIFEI